MLPVLIGLALLVAGGAAVIAAIRRRRRDARELDRRLTLSMSTVRLPDGGCLPLPESLWSLVAPGAADVVADAVRSCDSDDPQVILAVAVSAVDTLEPARAEQYAVNARRINDFTRDRDAWEQQDGLLTRGFEAGLLDAAVIGLAQADILRAAVSQTAGSLAASALSVPLPEAFVPDFLSALETQVGDAAGLGVGEAVGAIADSHLPILTVVSAVRAAKAASDAGLDSGRVADNLVADVGLKGGGIMAGAAAGTFLVPIPVVGTILGGIVGAFAGGEAANKAKSRHLDAAQDELGAEFDRLGSSVPAYQWRRITADAVMGVERQAEEAAMLAARARRLPDRPADRTVADLAIASASADAEADVLGRQRAVEAWCESVHEYDKDDYSTARGAILASSPELRRRVRLPDDSAERCLRQCTVVADERRKLALA